MLTWRHPRLPPPQKRATQILICALLRGQSRLIRVTGNEGCVRYPTEGNDSNHELTTAMHHLSYTLEGFLAFARRAVGFLALVRFFV